MQTKIKKDKVTNKKSGKEYPEEIIIEIKESIEDLKKGKYVKGDVNDIMKAIRDCENETDRIRKICKESK